MKLRSLTALGAIVSLTTPANAVSPVRIAYAGRTITTPALVVQSPSGTLVPLRAVTQALGGRMEWDEASKTAVVRHGGRRLEVNPRAHTLRLNGQPMTGLVSPRAAQGQLLVPLAGVERLFGVRGRWLPRQRLLSFAAASGGNGPVGRRGDGTTEGKIAGHSEAASGLRLRLTSEEKSYAVGDPITLTLAVTNPAQSPVTLQFSSSQKYDFEVRRTGQTVWRWSADRMFAQALTSLTLGPGERRVFTETWKQQDNRGQPVPGGVYEVIATLTTMGQSRPRSLPLTLRIGG